MAKKGGTAALQIEVNSDEEWDQVLERKGLVVVDVYTEWCGPCIAMMSNLKRIKLEQGSETLHLVLANANAVEKLERFRGRSEPTWMFIASGFLVKIFFGCNAPILAHIITNELAKELKCMAGEAERVTVAWDELTEEEKIKQSENLAKREMERERIHLETEMAKDRVKRRNLERLARAIPNQTVVVFFPHAITEPSNEEGGNPKRICQAAYRLMVRYDPVGLQIADQMDVTLRKDEIIRMLYNSPVVFPDEMLDTIHKRACIISLIQEIVPLSLEVKHSSSSVISVRSIGKLMDIIENKMATLVYGENKDPHNPKDDSVVKIYESETPNGMKIPPCWTPIDHISKAAAMKVLFPQKLANIEIVEEKMPPPSYIIIFEASRAHEVLDVAEPFADDVIHLAFFTSENPDIAVKICHLIHELEKKGQEVVESAKMVIALKKSKSDPMLTLASLGPIYISPDLRTGTNEMDLWFPPTIDIVEEPDPWSPPPPPPPKYWVDEEQNVYIEETRTGEDGVAKLGRRLCRRASGTLVEDGEWIEVVKEEPPPPPPEDKKKTKAKPVKDEEAAAADTEDKPAEEWTAPEEELPAKSDLAEPTEEEAGA